MGLGSLGLSAEVGGGAGAGEEAAEDGLEEGVEDNLGTARIWSVLPGDLFLVVKLTWSGEGPSRE